MFNLLSLLKLCSLGFLLAGVAFAQPQSQKVSPELAQFHERFAEKKLVSLGERVTVPIGYTYANLGFVEGDEGVIVIDTGWFTGTAQEIWDQYQSVSDKPVVAIILTHMHIDHVGGSAFFAAQSNDYVEVYAPDGWNEWLQYNASSHLPMLARRAYSQMGILLPDGVDGTVGNGIGPSPRVNGAAETALPTVTVDEPLAISIDGVRLEIIPTPGDIQSHMMVWLPDDGVLFAGDTLGGTLPYISTPRFEPDRDPASFITSLELAKNLRADFVIPGHGRLLLGEEDVEHTLQSNIDIIRYISHQVEREVTAGKSADEIIDSMELPPSLAEHPDLQPYYHRLEWLIRGLALKQAGFVWDTSDLMRLTDSEEAARLVKLLGGVEETTAAAQRALEANDPRWAARLATFVLRFSPDEPQAKAVRLNAFRRIAQTTRSANERNYALTAILEETEGIDWDRLTLAAAKRVVRDKPTSELLDEMSFRYNGSQAFDFQTRIQVIVDGDAFVLETRVGTLFTKSFKIDEDVEGEIHLSRSVLEQLWTKEITWTDSLTREDVHIISGKASVDRLASLIE